MDSRINWTNLTDFLYPTLERSKPGSGVGDQQDRESAEERTALARLGDDVERLEVIFHEMTEVLEREQARKHSVEARLTSIIGLMSIAATVVLSGLVALAAGTLQSASALFRWILALGSTYLVVQLVCALFAAIRGLSRKNYTENTLLGLIGAIDPAEDNSSRNVESGHAARACVLRRRIHQLTAQTKEQRVNTDAKVSEMAVAHRAVQNFLVGLLILAVLTALVSVATEPSAGDPVTEPANVVVADGITDEPNEGGWSQPPTNMSALGVSIFVSILGMVLFIAGGVLLLTGMKPQGAVMVAVGLTTTVLGGHRSVLQLESIVRQLRVEFALQLPAAQGSRVELTQIATIGPFPDADHTLKGDGVLRCLEEVLTPDYAAAANGWLIVGYVDKRPLSAQRATLYGSNQALAMSRAVWVRDHVLTRIRGFDVNSAVTSVGGARRVGQELSTTDLEADRTVEIYALRPQVSRAVQALRCGG